MSWTQQSCVILKPSHLMHNSPNEQLLKTPNLSDIISEALQETTDFSNDV